MSSGSASDQESIFSKGSSQNSRLDDKNVSKQQKKKGKK